MRILVTGAAGRLGSRLIDTLRLHRHEPIRADVPEFDVADFAQTRAWIADARPELVIHAAAWTDVDGCAREPENAIRINGLGAHNVALAAAAVGAAILYVSSNEVFDGESDSPYREYDPTRPINPYGYSKWVGEQAIQHTHPRHYVVRTAWLFAHGGKNFIQTILNAAKAGNSLRVVTDEVANPTYTDDLAEAIARLIATERYGVYHLVNDGYCSRYDFARHALDCAGMGDTPIEGISSGEWARPSKPPAFSPLENLAGASIGVTLRGWREAVAAFIEREAKAAG
jgi:dTDP-4-dehydrorhamnose reductase